jgi:SAM-dependent methyltransferase
MNARVAKLRMRAGARSDERGLHVAGGVTGYRRRTFELLRTALAATGGVADAVDVGAGDGWMARRLCDVGLVGRCIAIDVVRRAHVVVEPVLYDGRRLPMADASVDLAYAVDTVHHADDPLALLSEMARVSRRFVALKDHTCSTTGGAWMLRLLDEIGNRRFSISSPGRYQRGFDWLEALCARGFTVRALVHPAPCHAGVLGALTNRWQFVALLERPDGD